MTSEQEQAAREQKLVVDEAGEGERIDRYLADRLPEHSRSFFKRLIEEGGVELADAGVVKPKTSLTEGQEIHITFPPPPSSHIEPEPLTLDIIYEDDHLVVLNKRPGRVVHPAPGHSSGTLVHGLAYHIDELSSGGEDDVPRPGIVHRLDKDTSGVMVIAKSDAVHAHLGAQFKNRSVRKQYRALTLGCPDRESGLIDLPLGRSRRNRQKMAIRHDRGRPAQTRYRVVERFSRVGHLVLHPRTGRTHQIRVHLRSLGAPILADRTYGGRGPVYRWWLQGGNPPQNQDPEPLLERQALHAEKLSFEHPATGERVEFVAPLPADMAAVLSALREIEPAKDTP